VRKTILAILFLTACATTTATTDPYRWLEAVDDPKALAWVAGQNARTRAFYTAQPGFAEMERQALAALNSQSRIPSLDYHGRYVYNLWKDADHPRGLYRRATLDNLSSWTTVLDIDEMSRRDGKPWVFQSMSCLPPAETRCLMRLSLPDAPFAGGWRRGGSPGVRHPDSALRRERILRSSGEDEYLMDR
jgi:prolyl oligopeptidase